MKNVERSVDAAVAVEEISGGTQPGSEQTLASMRFDASHSYTELPVDGELIAWPYTAIASSETDFPGFHAGANLIDESLFNE
jgi:hypothetical protein